MSRSCLRRDQTTFTTLKQLSPRSTTGGGFQTSSRTSELRHPEPGIMSRPQLKRSSDKIPDWLTIREGRYLRHSRRASVLGTDLPRSRGRKRRTLQRRAAERRSRKTRQVARAIRRPLQVPPATSRPFRALRSKGRPRIGEDLDRTTPRSPLSVADLRRHFAPEDEAPLRSRPLRPPLLPEGDLARIRLAVSRA
jgi:hypothetical protein